VAGNRLETGLPNGRPAILALALVIGVLAGGTPVTGQDTERCYGVARAGENDGIDDREVEGSATLDYQGNAWVAVPAGTCLTRAVPPAPDGTPRRGSLEPLERDRP
jgi:uncharacterized membrane protein